MPIIKRRSAPEPSSVPPPAPVAASVPRVDSSRASPRRSLAIPIVLGIAALCMGVAVPFVVLQLTQTGDDEPYEEEVDESQPEVAAGDIELDLQRLQKIAAMAALIQKEYQANTVTRAEADKKAEAMTLAALDAILDKNRRELADAKERMAEVLVQIHAAYESSPRRVKQKFDAAIANAEGKDSPDVARALKIGVEALEAAPDDVAPAAYFKQTISENL